MLIVGGVISAKHTEAERHLLVNKFEVNGEIDFIGGVKTHIHKQTDSFDDSFHTRVKIQHCEFGTKFVLFVL
jgi:hypothetical protein